MPTFENIPVSMETLPKEIKQPIPLDITTDDFVARLKSGGQLELIDTTWEIGEEPEFGRNIAAFAAFDELKLIRSTIITNGNTLTLFANKIISDESKIVSFKPDERKAASGGSADTAGESGESGRSGDSGGIVSLHILDRLEGILGVDLTGQDGGEGGDGRKGRKGKSGARGGDASSGTFSCRRGGQRGHRGSTGFPGGNAGDGGDGGDGGTCFVFTLGDTPINEEIIRFSGLGGKGGNPGSPGPGGDGGGGGQGGRGEGHCKGGKRGPSGNDGQGGGKGDTGATAGGGRLQSRAVDIEVTVRLASRASSMPGS